GGAGGGGDRGGVGGLAPHGHARLAVRAGVACACARCGGRERVGTAGWRDAPVRPPAGDPEPVSGGRPGDGSGAAPDAPAPAPVLAGEGDPAAQVAEDDVAFQLAARAHAIFSEVLDEPPERRAEVLDRVCAGDAALRAWVEGLLEAESTEHPLLDTEVPEIAAEIGRAPRRERAE